MASLDPLTAGVRTVALAAAALLAVAACEPGAVSEAPSARCAEAGAQCALPDGPLGVCERAPCRAGEAAPCFACVPQH
ncbi:MAG: hypothetical protein DCC71_10575 [Proteobacteria bacterium]|nr:MAG: hypothetical protein DCC71_10575 [Pseudomonadota bacterium]